MTLCSSNTNEMNTVQNSTIFFHECFINQQIYVVYKVNCCDFYFQFVDQFQQTDVEKQI